MTTSIFVKKILRKSLLNNVSIIFIESKVKFATRMVEVGKLEPLKKSENYATGQLFLHKVFAYRGVVLFPWVARVYDRDYTNKQQREVTGKALSKSTSPTSSATTASSPASASLPSSSTSSLSTITTSSSLSKTSSSPSSEEKEVNGCSHTFYQVLIDSRDCPFILIEPDHILKWHFKGKLGDTLPTEPSKKRAQTEAVTFLGNQDGNRSLYAIPGLDYVSHDDILPYTTKDKNPLHHELFDKFLTPVPDKESVYEAQDTLKAWQRKNHPWLELSDVHKETTDSVRITVIPFYMGSRDSQNSLVYWWRYCIRMENLGTKTVQLRERHWRIFSLSGTLETVRGRGVVGHEPILSRAAPAFQYSSHVSLQAPSGHMWGTFRMEREDGYTFDCRIPPFSLESKIDEENPNPPSFGS